MKKVIAGALTACMLVSALPMQTFGATMITRRTDTSVTDSTEALKNVIINVKSKIKVPEELTEFTYNYINNNYSRIPYWNLTWQDKDYNSSITVRCDDNGNILYYKIYDSEEERATSKYLKEELQAKAIEAIKNLAPEIADNVEFEEATFDGVYNGAYTYKFVRIENGYRMPDNTVNVSLKYDTGRLIGFSVNWEYDCEIPEPVVIVSKDDAKSKIGENVEMELSYRSKTEEVDGRKITKAYLVYTPNETYVAIDAKTGEIYNTHDEYHDMGELEDNAKAMTSFAEEDAAATGVNFTEQEIKKMDELKDLISKEDAIKAITGENMFLIDENAKAVNATLYQNYDYLNKEQKEYIWRINIYDPKETGEYTKNFYSANINATVDAKTGKVLSFYASTPGRYNEEDEEWEKVNVKYSKDDCKKVLEAFIKKTEPEKFENVKLSDENEGYILKVINNETSIGNKYVYGGYDYNYARYNEGLEYSYNNIRGSVDGVTGKIYSYSKNWTDEITFESPKNILTEREAYNAYVDNEGFELVYEINNKHYIDNDKESSEYYDASELYLLKKEVRLVYRTNISPACVSPFTGKLLDYNGDMYEEEAKKEYNDIIGLWAERDIKLITDMGVIFEGEQFLPNKEITEKEFNDTLEKLGYYYYSYNEKEEELRDTITKLDSIKIIIDKLNLTKIAELEGIYKVEFNDINVVSDDDIGYVALAKGCKIISGDHLNNLNANKNLSRAEAVAMMIKLVNCNVNR